MDIRNGTREPLEIIPEEMWMEVFSYLHPSIQEQEGSEPLTSDLLSCSRVSKDFEKILGPTKTTWLFNKVFPELFWFFNNQKDVTSVLRCRAVCKEWNRAVDTFLCDMTQERTFPELPPIRRRTYELTRNTFILNHLTHKYILEEEDLQKFTDVFTNTHVSSKRSPFLTNSIRVDQRDTSYFDIHFWDATQQFLSTFGEHLHSFSYEEFNDVSRQHHFFLNDINKTLELLPNLKSLTIWGDVQPPCENDPPITSFGQNLHLETLKLSAMVDPSFVFQSSMITFHAQQLTRLEVIISGHPNALNFPVELPSLKELHVEIHSIVAVENFIGGLSRCAPSLVRIGFNLHKLNLVGGILTRIFALLRHFGKTLQSLNIVDFDIPEEVPLDRLSDNEVRVDLDLPFLRHVELESSSNISLNFLLKFSKSLEEFVFIENDFEDSRKELYTGEVVNCIEYFGSKKLYDSNIWEILPRLQFFAYELDEENGQSSHKFYRKEYKALKKCLKSESSSDLGGNGEGASTSR